MGRLLGRWWAPAYWPWVQIVRSLARRLDAPALRDELGESAPWIAGLLPELSGALGSPPPPSDLDPDQARFRLFDALSRLLAVAARRQPLVLVLDDLHWADASSLYALEFAVRMLADAPIVAVAAYRHTEAHARDELSVPLGGLASVAMRLPLQGLSREDVEQMAMARARGLGPQAPEFIASSLVEALHRASAGNPFFVDELVQLLLSQGRLSDREAGRRPLPLPGGVRDAIRRRLAPFGEPTREALGAAAVIGGEFRLATLANILDSSAPAVLERLDAPLRAGLVTVRSDPGRLAFVHALVRETLLEGLGSASRARLHRGAAETLERLYRDDPEPRLAEIAHHFLQAATEGGAERAVDYAARAARRAVEQFSYEEAARLYERAIDVAEALPADEERAWQLRQRLSETLMRAGDSEAARRALRAAAAHARRLHDPQRLAQSALASTLGGFSPGVVEAELVALLEEALVQMDPVAADDPVVQAADDDLRCRLRVQLALALLEFVSRELARATGIGGRDRHSGSHAERARVNVTRAIRATLKRIGGYDGQLGSDLERTVQTGTYCAYRPERGRAVRWQIEDSGR